MNRPIYNKFSSRNATDDFNSRMREYVVYLEKRDRLCTQLELHQFDLREMVENMHAAMEESHELRSTLKTLRSQIKYMWKENQCRLSADSAPLATQ